MRRVELFEHMRRDHDRGMGVRSIARKYHAHRRTVRQAIASAIPPERKVPERTSPVLTTEVKGFVDDILAADRSAPAKQRHTAHRIWLRVADEFDVSPAESTLRGYVSHRRREMGIGRRVFVPQYHAIGAQAEADFYEAAIDLPGGRQSAQIIVVRSEFSAAALHVAYPTQSQTGFLEGLELGLGFLGGVPERLRFDNLVYAVKRIIRGSARIQQDRFVAFRSHYLFEASFTTPGIEGGHEKGGVEGENGRFRRRWLTPVPAFSSWEAANEYLRACCIEDLGRRLPGRELTVGQAAADEAARLRPLPAEAFELTEVSSPRVDSKSRVRVRNNFYSVPASLVGRSVSVALKPSLVEITWGGVVVARHERLWRKYAESLQLDHYLEVLVQRPGAFPGSLALHQARARGDFPASYDELWGRLRARLGEHAGTKAMIEVLLLHRSHPREAVVAAVGDALAMGSVSCATVELLARQASAPAAEQLAFLDVGELARFDRALPDTAAYDALLGCGCGAGL